MGRRGIWGKRSKETKSVEERMGSTGIPSGRRVIRSDFTAWRPLRVSKAPNGVGGLESKKVI